jgi:hypothetical protein
MSNHFDKINQEADIVREVSWSLRSLSQSFHHTGNFHLAEKLESMAGMLECAVKEIKDSSYLEISERYEESQQSAYNTVMAALAMSEMKEK